MAAGLAGLLVACGGGQKSDTRTAEDVAEGEGEETAADPGSNVNPEVFDELTRMFNNKRPVVGRCYSDAVQSGKLDKKAKGRITLALSIAADGTAKTIKASQDTLRSPDVESCVIELVRGWDLPAPGDTAEFSFSYDFEPE